MSLKYCDLFAANKCQKQSKTLDDEAKGHQRNTRSVPSHQGPLRCKEHPWIIQV